MKGKMYEHYCVFLLSKFKTNLKSVFTLCLPKMPQLDYQKTRSTCAYSQQLLVSGKNVP